MADDIPRSAPVQPVGWQRGGRHAPGRDPRDPYARAARLAAGDGNSGERGSGERGAAVNLAWAATADLGPEARHHIAALIDEIERLRWEIDQQTARQAFLEDMADQHAYLPALNRRALLREVAAFLVHQESAATPGCLVLFYLANFEDLHRRFGLDAAEAALLHLGRQVAGAVRASDVAGSVGGAGLAVLMPMAESDGARRKAASLATAVEARPLSRDGVAIGLRVVHAVRPLAPGDTAEQAVAEADALLLDALWEEG